MSVKHLSNQMNYFLKIILGVIIFTFPLQGNFFAQNIKVVENAINGYIKENLGDVVNSSSSELTPVISADGTILYFVRKNHPENIGDKGSDDIWFTKLKNGSWTTAENIGTPLNNESHNGVISITTDKNTLFIAHEYKPDGTYYKQGLSSTQLQEDGTWSMPKTVVIQDFYNTNQYYGYCFSSNRQNLIMAIEREDTKGSMDLYISKLQEDGSYSIPKNMGVVINSVRDEFSPFLAADNQSLYFASEGHPGYGSADIFVSRRLDDTWINWSEPENLGSEINTEDFDAYFTIPASGDYAYLVSTQNSLGASDIFRVAVAESARPLPTILVTGKLEDPDSGKPLQGEVVYYETGNPQELGRTNSTPSDGSFTIAVPTGKSYRFVPNVPEKSIPDITVDLTDKDSYEEITIRFDETVSSSNIYFGFDSYQLTKEAQNQLDEVVNKLTTNTNLMVKLIGHADSTGDLQYNLLLSQWRTNSARNYLIQSGINSDKISMDWKGELQPNQSNETLEGRQNNRRIEIEFISK